MLGGCIPVYPGGSLQVTPMENESQCSMWEQNEAQNADLCDYKYFHAKYLSQ